MLKPKAKLIPYTILLSALILGLSGSSTTEKTEYTRLSKLTDSKGEKFSYDFTVRDATGKKIAFDEFKGKVLFINLWATWCGPCRSEMPTIQELYLDTDKDQVKFVMLSIDKEKTINNIEGYIRSNAYTFPVYTPSGYLPEQLQVPSIPRTFIVSKDGIIVAEESGSTNFNKAKYRKLLKQEAAK